MSDRVVSLTLERKAREALEKKVQSLEKKVNLHERELKELRGVHQLVTEFSHFKQDMGERMDDLESKVQSYGGMITKIYANAEMLASTKFWSVILVIFTLLSLGADAAKPITNILIGKFL
jgi:hypothetical protein